MIGATQVNPLDLTVTNDGFFPDLNVKDFQELERIKADLAPDLVLRKMQAALFQVNRQLQAFKTNQVALGFSQLQDIPQNSLGEGDTLKQELMLYYETAVFAFAMGELYPELVSLFRRKEATDYLNTALKHRQDYYNESHDALAMLQGSFQTKANTGVFSAVV